MKKRLFAAMMAMAMTASLLTGCGGGSSNGNQAASQTGGETDAAKKDETKGG